MLFMALGLDACLGEMPWLFRWIPHPVVLIGRAIAALDRRFNRFAFSARQRRWRGALVAILVPLVAAGAGEAISVFARTLPHAWLLEVFVAATLLAQRSLFDHVNDVARALKKGGLTEGRLAVARIVGRDPNSLDEYGVARAAVESLAENFADGVVAPALCYALLGLPGMMACKAVNTLDSMVGYKNDKYLAFGWASARLDDLIMLAPARLAGLMLALAACGTPKGNPFRAIATMITDARHHRSPNSGWPEAAMAGALGLALGGPRKYPGLVVDEKWIGAGRARLTAPDIDRALVLFAVACLVNAGAVAGLMAVAG